MAAPAPKQGPHRRRAGDSARPQLEDTQGFVRMHGTSGWGPGGRRNRTRSERVHCEPHSPESAPIRQHGLRNPRTSLARAGRRRAHRHRHPSHPPCPSRGRPAPSCAPHSGPLPLFSSAELPPRMLMRSTTMTTITGSSRIRTCTSPKVRSASFNSVSWVAC